MGGRGASSSYVYNKIESSFKDFIREKKNCLLVLLYLI